jgi:hypothetical protein
VRFRPGKRASQNLLRRKCRFLRRREKRLAFAASAIALAGHEIIDPVLLQILEQAALHEITTDDALVQIRTHLRH